MHVAKNAVVLIDYTLTDDLGNVIDTSAGRTPLAYLHGAGNIISGLEDALEGRLAGDELSVSIPPEQGYGVWNEELVQDVPRDQFEGGGRLEVGMQFQAQNQHGIQVVTVTQIDNDTVTVDANHPLAGQTLNFDVTICEIRAASAEELTHGHVHGPGGHHH
jgi:FKBP-type peptidyl-prolyl cis-trans isomerase SlyD